jgi:hypothetical protein
MIVRRRELELILEKTCNWFGIDSKPDVYLPPPPCNPIREFTFERVKKRGQLIRQRGSSKRKEEGVNSEAYLSEQVVMRLIDSWFNQLKNKRMFSSEVRDTTLNVKEDKRLMTDIDCRWW